MKFSQFPIFHFSHSNKFKLTVSSVVSFPFSETKNFQFPILSFELVKQHKNGIEAFLAFSSVSVLCHHQLSTDPFMEEILLSALHLPHSQDPTFTGFVCPKEVVVLSREKM